MSKVVIVAPDKRDHVRHDHAVADLRIALNLAVPTDVAIVAYLQLVGCPQNNPSPRMETPTDRIAPPLHLHQIKVTALLCLRYEEFKTGSHPDLMES